MEKSRKREAFEAIALVTWTLFSGGAGGVAVRYHVDGELAAAQEEREAAKLRLMESGQRERELKRQLELSLAEQTGSDELGKEAKEPTGKIKITKANTHNSAENQKEDTLSVVSWQQQMLDEHNLWRAIVGVPPLVWSAELERSAQQVVDQLAANGCELKHSGAKYGENLHESGAVKWSGRQTEYRPKSPAQIVAKWGDEADNYHWEDNACSGVCGHYTQIVWRNTKAVGCARARCANNNDIAACQYDPAGNVQGQKPF